MSSSKTLTFVSFMATATSAVTGFTFLQTPSMKGVSSSTAARGKSTSLNVAIDPTTVTKKEYEDICGTSFDDESLMKRLKATNYLYPKHVEVIDDIAPIAGKLTDEVVRRVLPLANMFSYRIGPLQCSTLLHTHHISCHRHIAAPGDRREGLAASRLPPRHDA